ncbi:MAG: hypothetical protein ISN29_00635 [Gammaproteobacteria bacterium AqS3]|nr:hypothetical protein [Gammaproteobacteria bacterium AqS3]
MKTICSQFGDCFDDPPRCTWSDDHDLGMAMVGALRMHRVPATYAGAVYTGDGVKTRVHRFCIDTYSFYIPVNDIWRVLSDVHDERFSLTHDFDVCMTREGAFLVLDVRFYPTYERSGK